jgi:hypothetical protein
VTATAGARTRIVVAAMALFVAVASASRSEVADLLPRIGEFHTVAVAQPDRFVTASDGSTIASVPAGAVPVSDRPVVAGAGKRAEGQRAPSLAPPVSGIAFATAHLVLDVVPHGSLATLGPSKLGLTRRGPPGAGIP